MARLFCGHGDRSEKENVAKLNAAREGTHRGDRHFQIASARNKGDAILEAVLFKEPVFRAAELAGKAEFVAGIEGPFVEERMNGSRGTIAHANILPKAPIHCNCRHVWFGGDKGIEKSVGGRIIHLPRGG